MADISAHTRLIVEELLPRAKDFVAESERRLAAQEARVADLQRKGHNAPQSKNLLAITRETMALQINYVKLLERQARSDLGIQLS